MIMPISPIATASSALPVGTRLGEFEITGVVGEGGFGIVYSALDSSLDRIVAVKEYLPSAFVSRTTGGLIQVKSEASLKTFQAGLSSFINEAKMLAKFSHPGLVEVFRFWEANGTAYMAMRYYRGVTLRQLLRTTPEIVTEQWLHETLDPILLALRELHHEKCYHRDVAPDNILILPNGRSVLMDFGAARRIIGGMTQALTVVLKPGFAPIEQYYDDGSMPQGAWTDVYALGGLLYHAMTGKVPVQAISRMMSDPLKPVVELTDGRFSMQFCSVVMKCLAVLPGDRYQSIDEVRAALGWGSTPVAPAVPLPAVKPLAIDPEATLILKASPMDATRATMMAPAQHEIEEPVAAALDVSFDPVANLPGMVAVPSPVAVKEALKAVRTPPPEQVATAANVPYKSKKVLIASLAVAVSILVGAGAFLYGNSDKRGETPSAGKSEVPAATVTVPTAIAPAPGASVTALPASVTAASTSSGAPEPVIPADASPASTQAALVDAAAPEPATGSVRLELKNGWATVFVDGENKGTAPPLVVVKLSPGSHEIELRNPGASGVKRTVEVAPGKTVVMRHTFSK